MSLPSKGTPRKTIRVSEDVWMRAEGRATGEGRLLVDVIREFLAQYGQQKPTE